MYTIEGEQTGVVRFTPSIGTITIEQEKLSAKVTSNPIESGSSIEDHVAIEPAKFTASGLLVGGQAEAEILRTMFRNRDICTYTGRFRRASLVITALDLEAEPTNKIGCSFKATFTQVSIISGIDTSYGARMTKQDGKKKKKKSKTAKKSGNTSGKSNAGQKSKEALTVSSAKYDEFTATLALKPESSSAPTTRATPTYSGLA